VCDEKLALVEAFEHELGYLDPLIGARLIELKGVMERG
jgi:hypothetical protein